jgi:hypothetical protein
MYVCPSCAFQAPTARSSSMPCPRCNAEGKTVYLRSDGDGPIRRRHDLIGLMAAARAEARRVAKVSDPPRKSLRPSA